MTGDRRTVRAVVFDVGGVLERVADPWQTFGVTWPARLGITVARFREAMRSVDPGDLAVVGQMNEAEYFERCTAALALSPEQAREFAADMWDWYCGTPDAELLAFAAELRPRFRTAILSNSADGARREEEARYRFSELFDPIIYSHEVGLAKPDPAIYLFTCRALRVQPAELIFVDDSEECVRAAGRLGVHAILHRSTAGTIDAIRSLTDGSAGQRGFQGSSP